MGGLCTPTTTTIMYPNQLATIKIKKADCSDNFFVIK